MYKPPPLLFITSTPAGMVVNVVLEGQLTKFPLTTSHAHALLVQLAHALEEQRR